jgi:parvulin-like peptidyl-prolyl isomerase
MSRITLIFQRQDVKLKSNLTGENGFMMQTLRKYMKHVMWIVAVTFIGTIIFSWGMGGFKRRGMHGETGIVGVINGQKIMYQNFSAALEEEYKKTRETENADELPDYRRSAIRDQVWNNMIREIVMAGQVQKYGLTASDEEVQYYVLNSPPPDIRSNPQFQTNGQFDPSKYQQALRDKQNKMAVISLENYYRMSIPLQKLQQRVLSLVRVSDGELIEAFRQDNEKVDVKYVLFDPTAVPQSSIHVAEKEIKAYYKEHQKEYLQPEQRKIEYVMFENKPTAADSIQTRSDVRDLRQQLLEGADFAELAKENSEDKGSAQNGGDLGFFGKGAMAKAFEEMAFSAKVGELVGPVETPFGLHLIKVTARKMEKGQTQVRASHILFTYKTSPETQDALQERAQYLSDEIAKTKGKNFAELARAEKMELRETDWFSKGGFIPGMGMASRINGLAFLQKLGWVSSVVNLDKNLLLFRISAVQNEKHRPFEEVKPSIQSVLAQKKQMEEAGRRCAAFRLKVSSPADFERIALTDSLQVKETGYFSMGGYVQQVGRDPKFIGEAFRLKKGELSGPVEGVRGSYIIHLADRVPYDAAVFEKDKDQLKKTLLQKKQNQLYSAWMGHLTEEAKIKDYRDQYY